MGLVTPAWDPTKDHLIDKKLKELNMNSKPNSLQIALGEVAEEICLDLLERERQSVIHLSKVENLYPVDLLAVKDGLVNLHQVKFYGNGHSNFYWLNKPELVTNLQWNLIENHAEIFFLSVLHQKSKTIYCFSGNDILSGEPKPGYPDSILVPYGSSSKELKLLDSHIKKIDDIYRDFRDSSDFGF